MLRWRQTLCTGCSLLVFYGVLTASEKSQRLPEPPALEPAPTFRIAVEPCKTRVMIASVHLLIGDLTIADGHLVGTYQIEVPMKTEKNETGSIRLSLPAEVTEAFRYGGELTGEGISHVRPEDQRIITSVFYPAEGGQAGEVLLTIELEERTLEFTSRYVKHGDFALALAEDRAEAPAVEGQPAS